MPEEIQALSDVDLEAIAELGRTARTMREILGWKPGDVVTLDTYAGAPLKLIVNNKVMGYGEIVVIEDRFAFRLTKVASPYKTLRK